MTKVNYFKVPGENSKGAKEEMVSYARSKKEACALAQLKGLKNINLIDVRELNFKTEVTKDYDMRELFDLRTSDKALWKKVSKKE